MTIGIFLEMHAEQQDAIRQKPPFRGNLAFEFIYTLKLDGKYIPYHISLIQYYF